MTGSEERKEKKAERRSRQERELDRQIQDALTYQVSSLPELPNREDALRSRTVRQIKEEQAMKKRNWNIRKVAVAAAAMCILGSAVVMAAGQFTAFESHSYQNEAVADYSQIEAMSEKYGVPFEVKGPESFSNGFFFKECWPIHESGVDDEGNRTQLATAVSLTYQKEGMADVNLNQSQAVGGMEEGVGEGNSHQDGEITYYYNQDHYKFVPPSYELSEEEQAAVDAGELYVSYGTDQVVENEISSVSWTSGGVLYVLQSFDTSLTESEMVEMAKEVME